MNNPKLQSAETQKQTERQKDKHETEGRCESVHVQSWQVQTCQTQDWTLSSVRFSNDLKEGICKGGTSAFF